MNLINLKYTKNKDVNNRDMNKSELFQHVNCNEILNHFLKCLKEKSIKNYDCENLRKKLYQCKTLNSDNYITFKMRFPT